LNFKKSSSLFGEWGARVNSIEEKKKIQLIDSITISLAIVFFCFAWWNDDEAIMLSNIFFDLNENI